MKDKKEEILALLKKLTKEQLLDVVIPMCYIANPEELKRRIWKSNRKKWLEKFNAHCEKRENLCVPKEIVDKMRKGEASPSEIKKYNEYVCDFDLLDQEYDKLIKEDKKIDMLFKELNQKEDK